MVKNNNIYQQLPNEKDFYDIKKEVIKCHKEHFDYYFRILDSIDHKVSNFLSVVLVIVTILVAYIGILIRDYPREIEYSIIITILLVAGIFLAIACLLIISVLKPHKIKVPLPLTMDTGEKGIFYKEELERLQNAIQENEKLLKLKVKKFGYISNLVLCSIILLLSTIVIFFFISILN